MLTVWHEEGIKEGKLEGIKEGKLEGIKEGKLEGIKEGKLEGIKEGKLEVAKKLLNKKFSIEEIAGLTGLPVEEIQKLTDKGG